MRITRGLVLISSLALGACSGSAPPAQPAATDAPRAAAAGTLPTPWDGLLKDQAKAKAVQKTVDDYAKRQRQAIDQQTH